MSGGSLSPIAAFPVTGYGQPRFSLSQPQTAPKRLKHLVPVCPYVCLGRVTCRSGLPLRVRVQPRCRTSWKSMSRLLAVVLPFSTAAFWSVRLGTRSFESRGDKGWHRGCEIEHDSAAVGFWNSRRHRELDSLAARFERSCRSYAVELPSLCSVAGLLLRNSNYPTMIRKPHYLLRIHPHIMVT